MDGTFKDIFNLTILLAVAVDADNHAIILAGNMVGDMFNRGGATLL